MNPYEHSARLQKAMRLEHALVAAWSIMPEQARAGRSLAEAVLSSPEGDALWAAATRAAGVREPSAETRDLVIRGLRLRERQMSEAELFAGLAG